MQKAGIQSAAALVPLVIATALFGQGGSLKPITYASDGSIPLPDYRKWVFIGSFTAPAEPGHNPQLTTTFVEPAAYDIYMKTGLWPDRTIIFSEKRASVNTVPITKGGWSQSGGVLAAEIEVKDQSKGGWVFYQASAREKTAIRIDKSMPCYSCHAEKGAVDNTFVQFYPALIEAAKKNGTYKPPAT